MLNNTETTETRTFQNDKIDARLTLETLEAPADTLTDGVSTFEFKCEPIYPFRIWCLPDAAIYPPSDTHAIEMQTLETPETEIPDLTPDLTPDLG